MTVLRWWNSSSRFLDSSAFSTVVAIVGLTGLTKTGNKSQCSTLLGSAQSAAATYYANTGVYPTTFTALTSGSPAVLTLPSGVTVAGAVMSATDWSITGRWRRDDAEHLYEDFRRHGLFVAR